MDVLKAQLDRLQVQLAGLTASQRMLAGCLVAIMAMTLLWWARYAGTAEMEPLLAQPLKPNEVQRITHALSERGARYTLTSDNRLLVPVDQKQELLAALSYDEQLPEDMSDAVDEAMSELNPLSPLSTTDKKLAHARGQFLAGVIRKYPRVRSARVLLDGTLQRGFGTSVEPSAMVDLRTDGTASERDKRKLARSAAAAVAGAQAGLKRERVNVNIDGATYPTDDEAGAGGGADLFEHKKMVEREYRDKIQQALRYIPDPIVSISVDVENRTMTREEQRVDPDRIVHKPVEERTRTEETTATDPPVGEPGLVPNSPLTTAAPAAVVAQQATRSDAREEVETRYELQVSRTHETSRTPAGKETVSAASVAVPRSYLVAIYRKANAALASAQEPTDEDLRPIEEGVWNDVRKHVASSTALRAEDIVVTTFYDADMPGLPGVAAADAPVEASSPVRSLLSAYAREVAIGALALVSLAMVASMVRKAAPAPALAGVGVAVEPRPTPHLAAGEEVVGEAGDGDPMLAGVELDEDSLRTQQMVDQVQDMVKENPDAAAALVKRWLNRS